MNYSFSQLLIQSTTHSVKYSFSEVLIQLNSRLCWVGRKRSKLIWTVRRSLWYCYGPITPVQLCFICHFQTAVSRLILTYDLWTMEQKKSSFFTREIIFELATRFSRHIITTVLVGILLWNEFYSGMKLTIIDFRFSIIQKQWAECPMKMLVLFSSQLTKEIYASLPDGEIWN